MAERVGFTLKWRGDDLGRDIKKATREAMDETLIACVTMSRSLVRVDTGFLRSSIRHIPARTRGSQISGSFGSYDVGYAIWQEIGTAFFTAQPYIRPARDHEWPQLSDRIRRRIPGGR